MSKGSSYEQSFRQILLSIGDAKILRQLIVDKDWHSSAEPYLTKLSTDARSLYVRLFLRQRGKWIRSKSLQCTAPNHRSDGIVTEVGGGENCRYREISCVQTAIKELAQHRFIRMAGESLTDPREALELLTADELRMICKRFKVVLGTVSGKPEIIQALLDLSRRQRTLTAKSFSDRLLDQIMAVLGETLQLDCDIAQIFERCHIAMFCLTELPPADRSTLHDEILSGLLGIHNYVPYDLPPNSGGIFKNAAHLMQYENALRLESKTCQLMDNKNFEAVDDLLSSVIFGEFLKCLSDCDVGNDPGFLVIYQPGWVLTRTVSLATNALGRLKKYHMEAEVLQMLLSQTVFYTAKRGRWWSRLLLIMERYIYEENEDRIQRNKRVLQIIKMCLGDQFVTGGWRKGIEERMARLEKSCSPRKPSKRQKVGGENLTDSILDDDNNDTIAEYSTKEKVPSITVKRLEAKLAKSQTGFAQIQKILKSVQWKMWPWRITWIVGGLDIMPKLRMKQIETRLSEIRKDSAVEILKSKHQQFCDLKPICVGINWEYPLQDLIEIIKCLGNERLADLCKLFAKSYKQSRSGFPDLFLWNTELAKIKVIEVKGPGDRLMDHQKTWIENLLSMNIEVEVCFVRELNTRKINK